MKKTRPSQKPKHRQRSGTSILIPGIWYLMINFPLICFVKSGITKHDADDRAKGLDRAVPGIPIPIFFVFTFGHYALEQWSHRAFRTFSVSYYKGDGHTEWFWLPVALPIIAVMFLVWIVYLWLFAAAITGDFASASEVIIQVFKIAGNALSLN